MAFREPTMIDVKEVLRRWTAGQTDRKIARDAGVDGKTAARYTAVAASLFERGRAHRRRGARGRATRAGAPGAGDEH